VFGFKVCKMGFLLKNPVHAKKSEQGYFYILLTSGKSLSFSRIWVNRKAVVEKKENDKTIYEISDWLTYRKTEKGNIVLMPSKNRDETIIYLFAECGFRGSSYIEVINGEVVYEKYYYHSPRGSIGTSKQGLYKVKNGTVFRIRRTGRLYGAPETITLKVVFTPKGLELIEAQEEEDEELKELL